MSKCVLFYGNIMEGLTELWFLITHPCTWHACRPIRTSHSSLTLEKKREHYRIDTFLYMAYAVRGNILTGPPLGPTGPTSPCSPRSPWNQNIRRCSSIHGPVSCGEQMNKRDSLFFHYFQSDLPHLDHQYFPGAKTKIKVIHPANGH